jgi:hypothetical protein
LDEKREETLRKVLIPVLRCIFPSFWLEWYLEPRFSLVCFYSCVLCDPCKTEIYNVGLCLHMSTLNLLHILAAVNNLGTTTLLP